MLHRASFFIALAIFGLTSNAFSTDPSGAVSTEEFIRKGWIPFHGKLISVDVTTQSFTIEINSEWLQRSKRGKQCDIYVTKATKITNVGKAATLKNAPIGAEVGGTAKNVNSKSIALSVEFNPRALAESLYKYGIPVKGRSGFVLSPYAPERPALNITGRKRGDEILDPYTGKILLTPWGRLANG